MMCETILHTLVRSGCTLVRVGRRENRRSNNTYKVLCDKPRGVGLVHLWVGVRAVAGTKTESSL